MKFQLPIDYTKLSGRHRALVRAQYVDELAALSYLLDLNIPRLNMNEHGVQIVEDDN